jgi:hypothetical protein
VAVLSEKLAEERSSLLQLIEQLQQTRFFVDDHSVKWILVILTIKKFHFHRTMLIKDSGAPSRGHAWLAALESPAADRLAS